MVSNSVATVSGTELLKRLDKTGVDPFVEVMSNLYAGLLTNQERLEPEFELVLHENLWELYES